MRNYNTAPDFNFDDDDFLEEPKTAQRPRPNVPPAPTYKVMGEDPYALPVPVPPQPMPTVPRQPTAAHRPPQTTTPRPVVNQNVPVQREPTRSLPALRPTQPRRKPAPRLELGQLVQGKARLILLVAGVLVAAYVAYLLVSAGLHAWQTWQDDMTFGRPRTMQLDQWVGHNETEGMPSHFIAQNNNRQITVIEYPGGDVSKTRVFQGPRLFGKDSELLPVRLRFEDVNGDNNVDMLISVDNQLIIYINADGTFRPITAEERAKIKLKQ